MQLYTPLEYPSHYPPTDRWKRFFIGVRWLGPDLSFFKQLRSQQGARVPGCMTGWGGGDRQALAAHVSSIFAKQLRWPCPYFLPNDKLAVIAGGPEFRSIDDLGADEAVGEIEEHLGITMGAAFWQAAASGTLGELVDQLLVAKSGA